MTTSAHASELSVGALLYQVTRRGVEVTWVAPDGSREHHRLAGIDEVVPRLDLLRAELDDGMALARGRVPRLREFAGGWGRGLVPDPVLAAPPDVLVVVPHSLMHDVPLHLVTVDGGDPLGCQAGMGYASSMSLFARCAARNPARHSERPSRTFVAASADVLTGREGMFGAVPLMVADRFAGGRGLLGTGVTRTSVKQAIGDEPDVLMLVAHGLVDGTDHRRSGLLVHQQPYVGWWMVFPEPGQPAEFRDLPLADAPAVSGRDVPTELLTAAELEINAQIRSELVMLLACSAGAGRVLEGDEPASLAETVLRLGAVSAVAALWDTDFAATRDWVSAFFVEWAHRGRPKAIAARFAMNHVRARVGDERPELFGALTVRGDWL